MINSQSIKSSNFNYMKSNLNTLTRSAGFAAVVALAVGCVKQQDTYQVMAGAYGTDVADSCYPVWEKGFDASCRDGWNVQSDMYDVQACIVQNGAKLGETVMGCNGGNARLYPDGIVDEMIVVKYPKKSEEELLVREY